MDRLSLPGQLSLGVVATPLFYGGCAVMYVLISALILAQGAWRAGRRGKTGLWLSGACGTTAAWAAGVALESSIATGLDLLQSLAWYGLILHLYRRSVPGSGELRRVFVTMGLVGGLVLLMAVVLGRRPAGSPDGLDFDAADLIGTTGAWSFETAARLGLAVCKLLLLENLYFNTPPERRWHVNLPCVALGGLFIYDIALAADSVLFHQVSRALFNGRAVATAIVAPLLAVAAARNRSWAIDIHVSRTAAFHSATLVASGVFLLGLAAAGQLFRAVDAEWGGVVEIGLIFGGVITVAVLVTSGSARSRIRRLVVDHFFTHRYDYRREWMRCITSLAAPDTYVALHTRVIRAIAEVVDSPGGMLFLREPDGGLALQWAGSWNMPAVAAPIMPEHRLLSWFGDDQRVVEHGVRTPLDIPPLEGAPNAWLAIPLPHDPGAQPGIGISPRSASGSDRDRSAGLPSLAGFVLLARSRAEFRLDREVHELLRIVSLEIATFVAEQQASSALLATRQLREYGKRFAFVAHDIKNVSSQLSLLLSNAEVHIGNPEFQQDMLVTVRASIQKISGLLRRLQSPGPAQGGMTGAAERAEAAAAVCRRVRGAAVLLETDGADLAVPIDPAALDAVLTHLLNNAVDATQERIQADAGPGGAPWTATPPVRLCVRNEGRRVVIEIVDEGTGMTPEFVRDALFQPFRTSKRDGSGIGAFQARELLREAGGDLFVISRPGRGTTMRVLLPVREHAVATLGAGVPAQS